MEDVEEVAVARKRKVDSSDEKDQVKSNSPVLKEDQRIQLPLEKQVDLVLNISKQEFACDQCSKKFSSVAECSNHYSLKHMHRCATCHREMPTDHLLDMHVLEVHDSLFSLMAEKKPMYSCLSGECAEKFNTSEARFDHCREAHSKDNLHRAFQHFEIVHRNMHEHPHKASKGRRNSKKKGNLMETDAQEEEAKKVNGGGDRTHNVPGRSGGRGIGQGNHFSFGRTTPRFAPSRKPKKSNQDDVKLLDMAPMDEALSDLATAPAPVPEPTPSSE